MLRRCVSAVSSKTTARTWQMVRPFSDQAVDKPDSGSSQVKGFAQAFEKHATIHETPKQEDKPPTSFATLLRNSKFVDLGDPEGRIVTGTIFHIVGDDLYIDFGWKFHCVCSRPLKNANDYVRGAKVRLRIKDLELSSKFLGSEKDLTLLEADAVLLGLVRSPARKSGGQ
ncbi:unnamed protein product [Nesidiocoris tenuis]|uniref:Uncharacterized protein n=1 Tax=Nesidiocoris tenuis TaxID=355587 RepID=A0A6H5FX25_9HEMI|nr:unnamed protein product [Nesidiocoris tenuis]